MNRAKYSGSLNVSRFMPRLCSPGDGGAGNRTIGRYAQLPFFVTLEADLLRHLRADGVLQPVVDPFIRHLCAVGGLAVGRAAVLGFADDPLGRRVGVLVNAVDALRLGLAAARAGRVVRPALLEPALGHEFIGLLFAEFPLRRRGLRVLALDGGLACAVRDLAEFSGLGIVGARRALRAHLDRVAPIDELAVDLGPVIAGLGVGVARGARHLAALAEW